VTSFVTGYQLGSVHLLFHKFSYNFAIFQFTVLFRVDFLLANSDGLIHATFWLAGFLVQHSYRMILATDDWSTGSRNALVASSFVFLDHSVILH